MHHGKGTLHTMFGPLPFRDGDYVVIPRTTTYRIVFEGDADLLVIESAGTLTIPPHYLNPDGQIRLGARTASAISMARRRSLHRQGRTDHGGGERRPALDALHARAASV